MEFNYVTNILNQYLERRMILDVPLPSRLSTLDFNRVYFIGAGSSFCVAKIAEFLCKEGIKVMPLLDFATNPIWRQELAYVYLIECNIIQSIYG
jgi:hypothetical protein